MIYLITMLHLDKNRTRCVGYQHNRAIAFSLLERNGLDVNEEGY